jgi:hypothetical protein
MVDGCGDLRPFEQPLAVDRRTAWHAACFQYLNRQRAASRVAPNAEFWIDAELPLSLSFSSIVTAFEQ